MSICSHHCFQRALLLPKEENPHACMCYLPKTRIFLPEGNLDLDRVETSLSIEDLEKEHRPRYADRHTLHTGSSTHRTARLTALMSSADLRGPIQSHSFYLQTGLAAGKDLSSSQ